MTSNIQFGIKLKLDGTGQFVGDVNIAKSAISGLSDAIGGSSKGMGWFSDAASKLVVGGGAVYAVTQVKDVVLAVGGALIDAQGQLDKFRAAFSMLGDSAFVGAQLDYVRKTAYDLGIELNSAMNSYRGFAAAARGTALEGAQTREVFTSVAKASTAMGLSASETEGVLLALSQMISKGTVQAEELRGQLGERLPGAFQIAARAVGVSTSELGKMLEQGQIIADDFLPKFARQLEKELGEASVNAAQSASRELERLKSGWADVVQALADSGSASAIGTVLGNIGRQFRALAEDMRVAKAEGKGAIGQLWAGITAGPKPAADVLAESDALLANPTTGMYARSSAAVAREEAARKLGVLGAAGVYAGEESRGSAAGFAAAGKAASDASAAVARFAAETGNLSSAQKKTNDQLALMAKYANSVKGVEQGSPDFEKARGALTQGLANIDEKYKPKAAAAAPKGKESARVEEQQAFAKSLADEITRLEDASTARDQGAAAVLRQKAAVLALLATLEPYIAKIETLTQAERDRISEEEAAENRVRQLAATKTAELDRVEEVRSETESIRRQSAAEEERGKFIGLSARQANDLRQAQIELRATELERKATVEELLSPESGLADAYRTQASELRKLGKAQAENFPKDELQKTFEDISKGLTDSLFRAAESGKSIFVALRDTIKGMFANLVLKPVIETGMKEGLSWLSTAAKALLFAADGAAFGPAGPITAFATGGVVNRPTLFPFSGGTGLMGEAGPEAIMPLKRGPDGKLGVVSQGSGGIVINQSFTFNGATSRSEAYAIVKAAEQQTLATLRDANRRGNDGLIGG